MIWPMKWIPDTRTLELSARNICALTDKLDDELSARSIGSPCGATEGATVTVGTVTVVAAPDPAHYKTRAPGVVFMPSTGETR